MTTSLDTTLIPKILTIIDDYGKNVTFQTYGTDTYDPATGTLTEGAKTSTVRRVTPPESLQGSEGAGTRFGPGSMIEKGDVMIMVAASGLTVTMENELEVLIDSDIWKVQAVDKIYTGDDIGAYALLLRK